MNPFRTLPRSLSKRTVLPISLCHPPQLRTFTMSASKPPSTPAQPPSGAVYKPRYIDIGINLTDPVYTGRYHGTQRHPSDLEAVIERSVSSGCKKLIVTGSDLANSKKAIELAIQYPGIIYTTIGVHPCSSTQFTLPKHTSPAAHLLALKTLATSAKEAKTCVAFGEIGLDYDRLMLCPKDIQLEYFAKQLEIAAELGLPLFLHSRAAHEDFLRILKEKAPEGGWKHRGVVHSFTGTIEEMKELVEGGWDIGVNGCSLKTAENCEVVKEIPLERLQVETDGPWCEIRASHAGMGFLKAGDGLDGEDWKWTKKEKFTEGSLVKGRNEPCLIGRVVRAVAAIKGLSVEEVSEAAWGNTVKMFGLEG